ncbi:hypothetical protein FDP41_000969 [Naegleria fowleri]|uniref:Uncharacterized protein n=1 Tax=Naegleria fowleri TaxID=5763 RepID=A0A6A5BWV6_NAEFO|nr:uncharacterized protein FDP41_000969 [Naegleria fowleri]KAF0979816.1 hypothetical protein FDP41_000969 [Naegleria fowleri]
MSSSSLSDDPTQEMNSKHLQEEATRRRPPQLQPMEPNKKRGLSCPKQDDDHRRTQTTSEQLNIDDDDDDDDSQPSMMPPTPTITTKGNTFGGTCETTTNTNNGVGEFIGTTSLTLPQKNHKENDQPTPRPLSTSPPPPPSATTTTVSTTNTTNTIHTTTNEKSEASKQQQLGRIPLAVASGSLLLWFESSADTSASTNQINQTTATTTAPTTTITTTTKTKEEQKTTNQHHPTAPATMNFSSSWENTNTREASSPTTTTTSNQTLLQAERKASSGTTRDERDVAAMASTCRVEKTPNDHHHPKDLCAISLNHDHHVDTKSPMNNTTNNNRSSSSSNTTCSNTANNNMDPSLKLVRTSSMHVHVVENSNNTSTPTCTPNEQQQDIHPFHATPHHESPSSHVMVMMRSDHAGSEATQREELNSSNRLIPTSHQPYMVSNPIQTNYLNDHNNSNMETPISVPTCPIATNSMHQSTTATTFPSSSTSSSPPPPIIANPKTSTTIPATSAATTSANTTSVSFSSGTIQGRESSPYPLPPPIMPFHHQNHHHHGLTSYPSHPMHPVNYPSQTPQPPMQQQHHAFQQDASNFQSHHPQQRYMQPPYRFNHALPPPPPTYHASQTHSSCNFYNQNAYSYLPHSSSSGHSYMPPPPATTPPPQYPYHPSLSSYPEYTHPPPPPYGFPPPSHFPSHTPSMHDMSKNFVTSTWTSNTTTQHATSNFVAEYNATTPTSITSSTTDRSSGANRPVPVAVDRKSTPAKNSNSTTPSKNNPSDTLSSTPLAPTKMLHASPKDSSSLSNKVPPSFSSYRNEHSSSNAVIKTKTGHITKEYVLTNKASDNSSTSDEVSLIFSFFIEPPHDIRMKKACLEVEVNENSNSQREITHYWAVKSLLVYENSCFFRFKKYLSGDKSEENWELDNANYDINGFSRTKSYDDINDRQKVYFSLESYGKRLSKSKYNEKIVTCPFKITLALMDNKKQEIATITKCICIHMDIKKVERKTVITKARFDDHLFETTYIQEFFLKYKNEQHWKNDSITASTDKRGNQREERKRKLMSNSIEQQEESMGDESSASSSQQSELKKKADPTSTMKRKKSSSSTTSEQTPATTSTPALTITQGSSSYDTMNEIVIRPEALSRNEFSSQLDDWSVSLKVLDLKMPCRVIHVCFDKSSNLIRIFIIIPRIAATNFDHSLETKAHIEIRFKGNELSSSACYTLNKP